MIKSGASAYQASNKFKAKTDFSQRNPTWSYDRFGKSITPLPSGGFIEIAGEHEDYYDPDFCIYNDVFIHDGKGNCKIYTYPKEIFPPTDFHTATLVNELIYVIGNLGYEEDRQPGFTQVFVLDLDGFVIQRLNTTGIMPGWISRHQAVYDGLSHITVTGGKLIINKNGKEDYIDNPDEFNFNIKTLTWSKQQNLPIH